MASVQHLPNQLYKLTISLEFGNYIGGDLESDDESDIDIAPSAPISAPGPAGPSGSYAPLEGMEEDEDEPMDEGEQGLEMTLHGVDGEPSPGWALVSS